MATVSDVWNYAFMSDYEQYNIKGIQLNAFYVFARVV